MTHTMALAAETSSLWFKIIVVIVFLFTVNNQIGLLPRQNVFTILFLTGLISSAVLLLGEQTGLPFGTFFYTDNLGWRLLYRLPWIMPLFWIAGLWNCREVAKLILRPWRDAFNYGWWLIGIATCLMVLLDAVLQPFATRIGHFWIWETQDVTPLWHGVPWMNFFGVAVVALFILGFITPWLINKRPGVVSRPNRTPLLLWAMLMLFFCIENAAHQFGLATLVGSGTTLFVVLIATLCSQK